MTQESYKLQQRALLLDFICIAVALATLYSANKGLLPLWALIGGALIALVLLVISIVSLIKSRKIERAAMRAENEQTIAQVEQQEENNTEP